MKKGNLRLPIAISAGQKGDFSEVANQCLEIILVHTGYSKINVFKGADLNRRKIKYVSDFKIILPPNPINNVISVHW